MSKLKKNQEGARKSNIIKKYCKNFPNCKNICGILDLNGWKPADIKAFKSTPYLVSNKYCASCKAKKQQHNPNPKIHSLHARNWQKNNKEKTRCSELAKYYSYKVRIIYECPCDNGKKHWHHFDYSRPFEVLALCPTCHKIEHKRL